MNNSLTEIFGEVISSYSRADAIEDGVLIDVSAVAKEAGISFPCCVTVGVWAEYVKVPAKVECQDESGRLWDILYMLKHAIKTSRSGGSRIDFSLLVRNTNRAPKPVKLYALCGPGDNLEPVITIMLPGED